MDRIVGVVVAALCACLAAGCASGSRMTTAEPNVGQLGSGVTPTLQKNPVPGSLACALRAPPAISLDVAGPFVLRPGAVVLRLCRYSGANARRPRHLSRSRLIRNSDLIHKLTRELNNLPQPRGTYHCPMDDGSEIVVHAGYRHLRPNK
jgi:hypothetical protein